MLDWPLDARGGKMKIKKDIVNKQEKMGTIDPIVRDNIEKRIAQIEKEEKVEMILAVESGSRAWGFESIDSDYDVRFIYRHDIKWYLNVLPQRDVIELPVNARDDYSGWDIRKTLFLLNKSNPVLLEWLKSPIIYKKDNKRFKQLVEAAKLYFSPLSSIYHYLHMAKGNYRDYLQGNIVNCKKYFYVLRPLLACMWIKDKKESPPVEFAVLLTMINDKILLEKINSLLKRKKAGIELGNEKAIPEINNFIKIQIENFENHTIEYDPKNKPPADYLNDLLWKLVR